jgi:hypothetical protein
MAHQQLAVDVHRRSLSLFGCLPLHAVKRKFGTLWAMAADSKIMTARHPPAKSTSSPATSSDRFQPQAPPLLRTSLLLQVPPGDCSFASRPLLTAKEWRGPITYYKEQQNDMGAAQCRQRDISVVQSITR